MIVSEFLEASAAKFPFGKELPGSSHGKVSKMELG